MSSAEDSQPAQHPIERPAWLPYLAPFFSFLLVVELSRRVPADFALAMLLLQVAVPLVLLIFFRVGGSYPELRFSLDKLTPLDVVLGIALGWVWMAPYLVWPAIRPELSLDGLQRLLGSGAPDPLVLSLRMAGFALVTPLMEELFMRSFLIRYAEVFDRDTLDAAADFRTIPIGHFSWRSFLVVIAVFLATHTLWQWWVMLPWAVLTTLWLYYRKELFALVLVHAATNATILLTTIALNGRLGDGAGGALSLWFFV